MHISNSSTLLPIYTRLYINYLYLKSADGRLDPQFRKKNRVTEVRLFLGLDSIVELGVGRRSLEMKLSDVLIQEKSERSSSNGQEVEKLESNELRRFCKV